MAKRISALALLVPMLMVARPVPAAAHVPLLFAIGLPFFEALIGQPGPYYGPPPGYASAVYAPPAYARAPVYAPARVFGPRFIAPPRRVFVSAYRGYGARSYYRPPGFRAGFRRW
jgi:hypothetical protein